MGASEGFEVELTAAPRPFQRPRVASGRRGKPLADLLAKRERRSPDLADRLDFTSAAMRAGALVRGWREARGLTQHELAEKVGVRQERISNIERGIGKHGPTFDVMTQIAAACGYHVVQAWGEADEGEEDWGDEIAMGTRLAHESAAGLSRSYRAPPGSALEGIISIGASALVGAAIGYLASYKGRRFRRGFLETLHEQPLVLGALGLAVGAAIGAALPATEKEDEWMGNTRDRLKERANEAGREQVEKARAAARAAYSAAREEAERQGLTPEGGKAATQSAAESVQRKAERVAEAATDAAKSEAERQRLGQTGGSKHS